MRNSPNWLKTAAFIFLVALLIIQVIRIDRTNPPVRSDLSADPAVKSVLSRACYNCHSNETIWPWYSGLAPVSWLVGWDVKNGRQHLNFSEWGDLDERAQLRKRTEIAEEVKAGEMPPWYYSMVRGASRLSSSEQNLIAAWGSDSAKAEVE